MEENTSSTSAFDATAKERPRLSRWPRRMAVVAAAVLLAMGFAAIAFSTAHESGLTAWDRDVAAGVVAARGDAWTHLFWAFTLLGNTPVLAMLTALAALTILLWGRRGEAAFIAAAVLSATGLSHLVKALLGRTRPEQALAIIETPTSYSLPSGHAFVTAVFLVGLVVLVWDHRSQRLRVGVVVTALVVAVLVGLSRVYLGVHWTSDVLAGWCLAGVWSVLLAMLLHVWRRSSWWLPRVKPWRGPVWRSAVVTILVVALAVIVVLEAAADPLTR